MSLVVLLLLLAVVAGIAVVAVGRGGALELAEPDRSPRGVLPSGDVDRAAVESVRFTVALRGYRMDEVDAVLDRLATEIEERDARIAELERAPRES